MLHVFRTKFLCFLNKIPWGNFNTVEFNYNYKSGKAFTNKLKFQNKENCDQKMKEEKLKLI